MIDLMQHLPDYYWESRIMKALMAAVGEEVPDAIDYLWRIFFANTCPDEAFWIWEEEYDAKGREEVYAKMRASGSLNREMLLAQGLNSVAMHTKTPEEGVTLSGDDGFFADGIHYGPLIAEIYAPLEKMNTARRLVNMAGMGGFRYWFVTTVQAKSTPEPTNSTAVISIYPGIVLPSADGYLSGPAVLTGAQIAGMFSQFYIDASRETWFSPIIAFGHDNIYFDDTDLTDQYSKITISGEIGFIPFAGNADKGFIDGANLDSRFSNPGLMAFDDMGNLYVADEGNQKIRCIAAVECTKFNIVMEAGNVYTIAGGGVNIDSGIPATDSKLHIPTGIALDSAGNLYISDDDTELGGDCTLKMIDVDTGILTVVGNNEYLYGDSVVATPLLCNNPKGASGLAVSNSGDIYHIAYDNNWIQIFNSSGVFIGNIGTGLYGYDGDGGPAHEATINCSEAFGWRAGCLLDMDGNFIFVDSGNHVIRKVDTNGIIITIAGNYALGAGYSGDGNDATAAQLSNPSGLAYEDGNLYVADMENCRIRKIDPEGIITTTVDFSRMGFKPSGIAVKNGELYVSFGCKRERAQYNAIVKIMPGDADLLDDNYFITPFLLGES